MTRYGLCIDVFRCLGCYSCVVGCKNWHKIKAGSGSRRRIVDVTEGDFPNLKRWIFPVYCMQCDNAPCVSVCPTGATFRRKDGIITIDQQKCIACNKCVDACPYNARYINLNTGKADGCDFCSDRLDKGLVPYCVETCPGEAMIFGNLDDPNSKISQVIKEKKASVLKPELNTKPKLYYANLHYKGTAIK
jgi:Fe-S-cluster-containing dehydrogenase component